MPSLLGQYYSRIKGSQEDIASEGLVYILNRSITSRDSISRLLHLETGISLSDLTYISQSTGAQNERPDISGINPDGREELIIEAKFWASLTKNQPLEYLNRLNNDSILLFICPALRLRSLWDEIHLRLKQANLPYQENKSGFVLANNKQIVIKSWSQVLETIRFQLIQDRNQELLSDLDQIIGFCEIVDKDSFLPIQDTDLSPSIPKRVNSYYLLADKVVDELKRIGFANTEKLNATPQKFGYTRYFHLTTGRDAAFYVHFELWEKNADTPFWLRLYDSINGKWCVREQTIKKLKEYAHSKGLTFFETNKREFYLPVYPLQSASEEEVVTNLVSTLQEIFHYVDS